MESKDNNLSFIDKSSNSSQNKWSSGDELLLKEWAEHALCYKWLHEEAHLKYNAIHTKMSIPVIIISTITGTANFAQGQISDAYLRDLASMIIGALSLIAGIIATLASFFKISELKENHYNHSKLWDKFFRNIQVELSKPPSQRIPKKAMVDLVKKDYDRYVESAPIIPEDIRNKFNVKFSNVTNIKKPNIIDSLSPINIGHDDPSTSINIENMIDTQYKNLYGRTANEFEKKTIIEMATLPNPNLNNPLSDSIHIRIDDPK